MKSDECIVLRNFYCLTDCVQFPSGEGMARFQLAGHTGRRHAGRTAGKSREEGERFSKETEESVVIALFTDGQSDPKTVLRWRQRTG